MRSTSSEEQMGIVRSVRSQVERRDLDRGLDREEVRRRLEEFGPNELPPAAPRPLLLRFAMHLAEPMSLLLIVAAAVSGVGLGDRLEAIAIVAIVVLNAVVALVQEGRAQRALDALRSLETPMARVRRDGRVQLLPAPELVPGDVVLLEGGDRVPADGELVEAAILEVDESILTGESLPVPKDPDHGARLDVPVPERGGEVFTGTLVVRGSAVVRVLETGPRTQLGRIAESLRQPQSPTPLQRELSRLTARLGAWAVVLSAGVFALVLVTAGGLHQAFLTAVALAVAAVPEGLAAVTTVALALGVGRMARRGAVVRRMPAVEALGATDVLAIDKTGTVTENRLDLAVVVTADGRPYELTDVPSPLRELLEQTAVLSSTATLDPPTGDPMEIAVLRAVGAERVDRVRRRHEIVASVPFDAERRRLTVIARSHGAVTVHVKGAPETVLGLCDGYLGPEGDPRPLAPEQRERLERALSRLADSGLRLLGVARGPRPDVPRDPRDSDDGLSLVGVLGLRDPVRPAAAQAVRDIRDAGMHLLMVTGDHPGTARAIAEEIGIARPGDRIVTGTALLADGPPDEPLDVPVYARIEPGQKLRLVGAIQERGHAVAMTGDGVNDAPALQRADIGVALGATGSDVAREAADLVILDDDLATIAAAVREGRGIYDNIRKVVDYLVAGNLSEIAVVVVALLAFPELGIPLLPLQLLWINLLTDGLPAIALGVDPVDPELMRQPPRPRSRQLLTLRRIRVLAVRGALLATTSIGALWVARAVLQRPWPLARTVLFTALVVGHLLYAYNARRSDPTLPRASRSVLRTPNRWLLAAVFGGIALQVLVVAWPPARAVFSTTGLSTVDWLVAGIAGVIPWAVLASLPRPRRKSSPDRVL